MRSDRWFLELPPRDAGYLYNDEASPDDAPSYITDGYIFDAAGAHDVPASRPAAAAWLTAQVARIPALRWQIQRRPGDWCYPRFVDGGPPDLDYHLQVTRVGATTRAQFLLARPLLARPPARPTRLLACRDSPRVSRPARAARH